MTVAELQMFLTDLSKFLRASEGAKVAGELEYVATRLDPFKGQKLKAFADFLVKVDDYQRNPPVPVKGAGGGKTKTDPEALAKACSRVLELYNQAIDPSVTVEQIEAAVKALEEANPTNAILLDLAHKLGNSQKFSKKADTLKAIRQKVLGRKGAFDRVNA